MKQYSFYGFALFFIITINLGVNCQNLKQVEFGPNGLLVTGFNNELELSESLPLVSLLIDGDLTNTKDAETKNGVILLPKEIQVGWESYTNFDKGIKGSLVFKNTGKDTISISNVVPFGENPSHVYITGKGNHNLSRTHLFRPGLAPVNVIVPDNAWELGYSSFPLTDNLSVCALVRRTNFEKAKRKRFEIILEPEGSVTYNFYADLFTGEWQEGLRKIFQERYLYDVDEFDNSLYEREDLKWIRNAYVMHLLMAWDKRFYDSEKGEYTIGEFLKHGKSLYGGDDVIGIWPTWPTLGTDQRNQFDLFRDLPGGLEKIKLLAHDMKKDGTSLFLCYNPWDESTRGEGHIEGLIDLISGTDADGVVLDTRGESSKEFQDAVDSVKKGVIMYSEGMAVPKNMPGIVSGRVHNALYYPPFLNLNKFIKPEFAIFRVGEIFKETIQREYAISFFNGHGIELNIFRPGTPTWAEEQYRYLGKTSRILRENSPNFNSKAYIPLIPTLQDIIYVNKWPSGDKTIYTVFSLIPEGFKNPLFEVDIEDGFHFVDLWHHKLLNPIQIEGKNYVEVEVDAFNKSYLGTNNEGEVDCIARLPKVINALLNNDVLEISTTRGDVIKIWAGVPSYDKKALELPSGIYALNLSEHFGRYEGDFVVQVFDKSILLDETIVNIETGEPRLVSTVETTEIKQKVKSMAKIPSGHFTFKTTNGDAFIPYPNFRQGKTFEMKSFLMDKHPVTNAEFKKFMNETNYQPKDKNNFLKHWSNGQIPKGEENYPVVYVSYEDAKAYAIWAKKRLPTELEWQYAAQTEDTREWPWSKNTKNIYREEEPITETLTVFKIKGIESTYCNLGNGKLEPVGKYPKGANPYGLEDLVGSVWQLTNDLYQVGSYDYIIMKGGSYYNPASSWWYLQGGPRELHYREHLLRVSQGFERNATVGFRCVKDL